MRLRCGRAARLMLAVLAAASFRAAIGADEVVSGDGARTSGWIVKLTPQQVWVLTGAGQLNCLPAQDARLAFDLATLPRCAVAVTADGQTVAVRCGAWKEEQLEGWTADGLAWAGLRAQLQTAEFYPTSRLNRTLPVAFAPQKPDYCGEACVAMAARFFGQAVSQDEVNAAGGRHGERGVYSQELEAAVVKLGLKPAPAGAAFSLRTPEEALLDRWRLILALDRCRPVLLGVWADPGHKTPQFNFDHFVLLIGYDLPRQALILHDPGAGAARARPFAAFAAQRETRQGQVYQIEFPGMRTWTLTNGHTVAGALVGVDDEHVRVKTRSGEVRSLSLSALSAGDVKWLAKLR